MLFSPHVILITKNQEFQIDFFFLALKKWDSLHADRVEWPLVTLVKCGKGSGAALWPKIWSKQLWNKLFSGWTLLANTSFIMLLYNLLSRWGLSKQQKYVAVSSKCCHSSSAVSEKQKRWCIQMYIQMVGPWSNLLCLKYFPSAEWKYCSAGQT